MLSKTKDAVARVERRLRESREMIERSVRIHHESTAANREMRSRILAMRLQLRKTKSLDRTA